MNMWQKICIATGAILIALMLTVFPATKEVNVKIEKTGFGAIGDSNKTTTVTKIETDYAKTGIRVGGVAAATIALTILLGFIKENPQAVKED